MYLLYSCKLVIFTFLSDESSLVSLFLTLKSLHGPVYIVVTLNPLMKSSRCCVHVRKIDVGVEIFVTNSGADGTEIK